MNPTPDQAIEIWKSIAKWWDAQIGEGNEFQQLLIMPATDRLLDVSPGQHILDIACGNGNYARRLGKMGASVMAVDGSSEFISCAKARTREEHGQIEYRRVDATDARQLLDLGLAKFDSAVCSMALMDIPTIT